MKRGSVISSTNVQEYLREHFQEFGRIFQSDIDLVDQVVNSVLSAFLRGNKLLICGNGGSASEACHVAAEYQNGMSHSKAPALPAISLTSDLATITAHANDYSFETIFSLQIDSIGKEGDILLCLSTSGTSKSIVAAIESARNLKILSVLIRGNEKNRARLADLEYVIPTSDTQVAQEISLVLNHYICKSVIDNYLRVGN